MAKTTYTLATLAESSTLPCTRCNGSKMTRPIDIDEAKTIPARSCPHCDGIGTFKQVDIKALLELIKGRKPGTLRSRRPDNSRAYYVWRMARFHGGADVTMPMTASLMVSGDPYVPLLDAVAEKVAQTVYGTDRAGAVRWAHAMGHEVSDAYLRGEILPDSAYPGGPVVTDKHKPYSEMLELK